MRRLIYSCSAAAMLLAATFPAAAQTLQVVPNPVTIFAAGQPVQQPLLLGGAAGAGYLVTPLSGDAPWLTVNPRGGTLPATVILTADPAGLQPGTYTVKLSVSSGLTAIELPVTLTVSSIAANPTSLQFSYAGAAPPAQTIAVTGPNAVGFAASVNPVTGGAWLQLSPGSGLSNSTLLSVSLNTAVVQTLAAGQYTSQVIISPGGGTSIVVPVTLTVAAAAQYTVSPSSLTFNSQTGSATIQQQTVTITNNSSAVVNYGIAGPFINSGGVQWLNSVSPSSGFIQAFGSQNLTVTMIPSGLPNGSYSATFSVFINGTSIPGGTVGVQLNVSDTSLLSVPTGTLTFVYQVGGAVPPAQTFAPTSSGAAIFYTLVSSTGNSGNWLSVPASGTTPNAVTVSVNPAGLGTGNYNGAIVVTAPNGQQTQVPVLLIVTNNPAVLTSAGSQISFAYQVGQQTPAAQSVSVSSSSGAALNYVVSASDAWIFLGQNTSGVSGTASSVFTVQVATNLAPQTSAYTGSVTVRAYLDSAFTQSASNSPLVIPVRYYVSTTPLLQAGTLQTFVSALGSTPATQNIAITSTSTAAGGQLSYQIQASTDNGGPNWLLVSPSAGTTGGSSTVQVQPSAISPAPAPGIYTGRLTVSAFGSAGTVANSPLIIPVTYQMTAGTLTASPTSLAFTQTPGSAPAPQTIGITSSSGQTLSFTAGASTGTIANTWLTVTPSSGTTPATLTVSVDASRLPAQAAPYTGTITVASAASGQSLQIPVTFAVGASGVSVTPSALNFQVVAGGAQAAPQNINLAGATAFFTATASAATGGGWLSVSPTAGTLPAAVTVTTNASNLGLGTFTGSVVITAPGVAGSPFTIPVSLTVSASSVLSLSPAQLNFSYTVGQAVPSPIGVAVATTPAAMSFSASAQTSNGGNWLTLSSTSGFTPVTITAGVAPQSLSAGTYTGTIVVTTAGAGQAQVAVTLVVTGSAAGPPVATTIVNAASFVPGAVAPGELITIGGAGLGPDVLQVTGPSGGFYPTTLSDTQVLFDGAAAPIYYVSARQTSVFVPYNVNGRLSTRMVVVYKGLQSQPVDLRVVDASPAIFTVNQSGSGPGVIQNSDYSLNSSTRPIERGGIVIVWATGEGQTTAAGVDGQVIPLDPARLKRPLLPVTATIGGRIARVLYAGSAAGLVSGVLQVNLEVPADAPTGDAVPVTIAVGTAASQAGVTLAVR